MMCCEYVKPGLFVQLLSVHTCISSLRANSDHMLQSFVLKRPVWLKAGGSSEGTNFADLGDEALWEDLVFVEVVLL
jgi:hypothetical protein